jgi:hypothetical protein
VEGSQASSGLRQPCLGIEHWHGGIEVSSGHGPAEHRIQPEELRSITTPSLRPCNQENFFTSIQEHKGTSNNQQIAEVL